MKQRSQKSPLTVIAIVLILIAVLARRMFVRNMNMDYLLYFAGGLTVAIICYLIFKKRFQK